MVLSELLKGTLALLAGPRAIASFPASKGPRISAQSASQQKNYTQKKTGRRWSPPVFIVFRPP